MAALTPSGQVLVVNAGSSSLKLQILAGDGHRILAERRVEGWDGHDVAPIAELVSGTEGAHIAAVGHRVVHGGPDLQAPTLIDDVVVRRLHDLVPLAPLHQERSLAGITAAQVALPQVPHVACFDTAYHATIGPAAATYALPAAWRRRWPLQRFGFHGLSHSYAARRAAELLDRTGDPDLQVVSCHLGAGASLCASRGGRSVDTTMGFTPLEGLVMGSRSGSVDPGLVLWLVTEAGLPATLVRSELEHASGLVGLAGTPEMDRIVERAGQGETNARLALDVYGHVLVRHVGAMAAALGGIDVLVFTGGVGERSPEVRAAASERLGFLGLGIDPDANAAYAGHEDDPDDDGDISDKIAPTPTLVVHAREDVEIARLVRELLAL